MFWITGLTIDQAVWGFWELNSKTSRRPMVPHFFITWYDSLRSGETHTHPPSKCWCILLNEEEETRAEFRISILNCRCLKITQEFLSPIVSCFWGLSGLFYERKFDLFLHSLCLLTLHQEISGASQTNNVQTLCVAKWSVYIIKCIWMLMNLYAGISTRPVVHLLSIDFVGVPWTLQNLARLLGMFTKIIFWS